MRGYVDPVRLEDLTHIYQQFDWPAEQVLPPASSGEEERPGGTAHGAEGRAEQEGDGSTGIGSQASV